MWLAPTSGPKGKSGQTGAAPGRAGRRGWRRGPAACALPVRPWCSPGHPAGCVCTVGGGMRGRQADGRCIQPTGGWLAACVGPPAAHPAPPLASCLLLSLVRRPSPAPHRRNPRCLAAGGAAAAGSAAGSCTTCSAARRWRAACATQAVSSRGRAARRDGPVWVPCDMLLVVLLDACYYHVQRAK